MKLLMGFFSLLILVSCSPASKFRKDKTAFEQSKTIESFKAVADLNDSYFDIKENNFFEFYRQLFDSVKNTSIPGRYTMHGDTMLLNFYDKNRGAALLGTKALVNHTKREIVFFK